MDAELDGLLALLEALPMELIELDGDLRVRRHSGDVSSVIAAGTSVFELPGFDAETHRSVLEAVLEHGGMSSLILNDDPPSSARVSRVESSEGCGLCLVLERGEETTIDRVERERLQVTVNATQIGLWSWDMHSQTARWDERMYEITGVDSPMPLTDWVERLTHPDDRETVRAIREGLPSSGPIPQSTTRIIRPDGEIRWVTNSGAVIADDSGAPRLIVGGVLDVTEQYRLSAELEDARRREAMGHLTSGVAHNFNNMLMIIQPCLERLECTVDESSLQLVTDALAASKRASEIVKGLMTFAGQTRGAGHVRRSAAQLCRETARLCAHRFPEGMELSFSIDTEAAFDAPAGAIEQVLSNIILNARDILVEHRVEEPLVIMEVGDQQRFEESWVQITVSDNGPGVPADIRSRIFEPFFTTRRGDGTGLGLATSDAIVSQLGGQLACRPSEHGGAEFMVLIPAATDSAHADEGARPKPPPSTTTRPLEVLMVDDEPAIRRIVELGLRSEDMVSHMAESAEAALELLDTKAERIDFILLDRSLGRSRGGELLPELRSRLPGVPIYFLTGEHVEAELAAQVDGVLQKPFSLTDLAEVIRRACTNDSA